LSSFLCTQDPDIESFLKERSVHFEKLSKSRTYLEIDEDALARDGTVAVLGYFSLAMQTLKFPEEYSGRRRKELDGFASKRGGKPVQDVPCFLIGQLARCSSIEKGALSGSELLDDALGYIAMAQEAVGGRIVLVECRDDPKLIRFYEGNRFEEFMHIGDDDRPMIQMIRRIC